jgi:hypothetical protein
VTVRIETAGHAQRPIARALIEGTDLVGSLALYGVPADQLRPDVLPSIRKAQQDGRLSLAVLGSLHLRDVRPTAFELGAELVERLTVVVQGGSLSEPVFRAVHAADVEVLASELRLKR